MDKESLLLQATKGRGGWGHEGHLCFPGLDITANFMGAAGAGGGVAALAPWQWGKEGAKGVKASVDCARQSDLVLTLGILSFPLN